MDWLDKLRAKPLADRKKIAWAASISLVVIIAVISFTFLKEWEWPGIDPEMKSDLKDVAEDGRQVSAGFKDSIDAYNEVKEEIALTEEENLEEEMSNQTTSKKNVAVTITDRKKSDNQEIIIAEIANNSQTDVKLSSIKIYQGIEQIVSDREILVAAESIKNVEVVFPLTNNDPVTGFEIGAVTWSNPEASTADLANDTETWSYLFRIDDNNEAGNETTASPEPPEENNNELNN